MKRYYYWWWHNWLFDYCILKKKIQVEIFEKKNLGGIINDLKFNGDFYFNGPNFFDVKSGWIKILKKIKRQNFFQNLN